MCRSILARVPPRQQDFENSANDARSCIKCDKTFIKGYFRLVTALKAENKLKEAEDALKMGAACARALIFFSV